MASWSVAQSGQTVMAGNSSSSSFTLSMVLVLGSSSHSLHKDCLFLLSNVWESFCYMKASPMRKLSSPQENATMNIQMILWIQFSPSTKYRIPWIVDSFKIKQTEIRCRFSLSKKNCSSPGDTSLYSPGSCRPLMIWINWVEQSTVTVRSFTHISHKNVE